MIGFSVDEHDAEDSALTDMLKEFGHDLSDHEARDILRGCLRDLSGSSADTLPELAFRLMRQRIAARRQPTRLASVDERPIRSV